MKRNTLFRRFIIQSIISFLVTGGLLIFFVSNVIIKQEIEHNFEVVNITLGHSLEHWFEEVDIYNLTTEDLEELDKEFLSISELGDIAEICIWTADGKLAYSYDDLHIFNSKVDDAHMDIVESREKEHKIITTDTYEYEKLQAYGKELIKITLPITYHNEVLGFFEVYRTFDNSRVTIRTGIRDALIALAIGLIVLYFLLVKTIYNSSNKLINHTNELVTSYYKLNNLFKSMIKAITKAVDARDQYTSGHSQRVAEYTVGFAQYLGFDQEIINRLEIAALLHDIGKLGVPESVINKPGALTDEEFNLIKKHPLIGEQIIEDIDELQDIMDAIKYHHEKFSGDGYPTGIKNNEIPIMARIITLTDSYDAMTSDRPYRKMLSEEIALAEIKTNAGTQFDPELAKSFIEYINSVSK